MTLLRLLKLLGLPQLGRPDLPSVSKVKDVSEIHMYARQIKNERTSKRDSEGMGLYCE